MMLKWKGAVPLLSDKKDRLRKGKYKQVIEIIYQGDSSDQTQTWD